MLILFLYKVDTLLIGKQVHGSMQGRCGEVHTASAYFERKTGEVNVGSSRV
jgi:hypothetical protein